MSGGEARTLVHSKKDIMIPDLCTDRGEINPNHHNTRNMFGTVIKDKTRIYAGRKILWYRTGIRVVAVDNWTVKHRHTILKSNRNFTVYNLFELKIGRERETSNTLIKKTCEKRFCEVKNSLIFLNFKLKKIAKNESKTLKQFLKNKGIFYQEKNFAKRI